jgi:hypothetical protein
MPNRVPRREVFLILQMKGFPANWTASVGLGEHAEIENFEREIPTAGKDRTQD